MMRSLLCVLLFLIFTGNGLTAELSGAGERRAIEYGYPDQSIFVASIDDAGPLTSPMMRLVEVLMERADLSWHATAYPAKRLFYNLRNGITNFSILVKAPSLYDCCIFSREPIYTTSLNIYFLSGKPSIASKEEMVGKKIITIRGYSYAGLRSFIADPGNRIMNVVAGTHAAAFEMLKKGRADYLLDYASAAADLLSNHPVPDLNSTPMGTLEIFLILSKSYPGAQQLMRKLENIICSLDVEEILFGR